MMKKNICIFVLSILFILAGCGSKQQGDENSGDQTPQPLNVVIETNPETIEPNQTVEIRAIVTQGNEKVEDANEVKFELWKDGQEEHEMLTGVHQGEGIYSIEKSFTDNGIYYVIAHVTARDLHNMPKKELIVGKPTEPSGGHHDNKSDGHHDEHHAHHDITFEMKMDQRIRVNQDTSLLVKILKGTEPLSEAEVQFEIWRDDEEQHLYVIAKEVNPGEYHGKTSFSKEGTHHIKVHLLKDTIHDHKEYTIEVEK